MKHDVKYCLLRIPFILLYDYLFTEKFSAFIEYAYKYSIRIIDHENHLFAQPIGYILHSSLFHILIQINLLLSIPIIGKDFIFKNLKRITIFLFLRSYCINTLITMF
jgi:hypothetical protein